MLLLTPTVDCASTLELNIPLSNYSIFKWDAKKGHFPCIFGTEVVLLRGIKIHDGTTDVQKNVAKQRKFLHSPIPREETHERKTSFLFLNYLKIRTKIKIVLEVRVVV